LKNKCCLYVIIPICLFSITICNLLIDFPSYNCQTVYDNAYLITFKVGPLRAHTHTHLLHRSCHCWKHRRKVSSGIFRSSAVAFDLMSSMVAKPVPLRSIFRVEKSQKALGARSGEHGVWVMTGMLFSASNCCTTSDVWLGVL